MMLAGRALEAVSVDEEWQALRRLISRSAGFSVVVYFLDEASADHISRLLRAGGHGLDRKPFIVNYKLPDVFVGSALARIYQWGEFNRLASQSIPIFVELFRGEGDSTWRGVRREFFVALNQARSRMEREVLGPLIVLLPIDAMRDFAALAPDIWHVRTRSRVLETRTNELAAIRLPVLPRRPMRNGLSILPSIAHVCATRARFAAGWMRDVREMRASLASGRLLGFTFQLRLAALSKRALDVIAYYLDSGYVDRAHRISQRFYGLLAEVQSRQDASPWFGIACDAMSEAARRTGDLAVAEEFAKRALRHLTVGDFSKGDHPRDLQALSGLEVEFSELLYRLGSISFARGKVDAAEDFLREGIRRDRLIVQRSPYNASAWENLLVGLNRLGDLYMSKGDATLSLKCFEEARGIAIDIYRMSELGLADAAHVLRSLNGMIEANRRLGRADIVARLRESVNTTLANIQVSRRYRHPLVRTGSFFIAVARLATRHKIWIAGAFQRLFAVQKPIGVDALGRMSVALGVWCIAPILGLLPKERQVYAYCSLGLHFWTRRLADTPDEVPLIRKYRRAVHDVFSVALLSGKVALSCRAAREHFAATELIRKQLSLNHEQEIFESLFLLALASLLAMARSESEDWQLTFLEDYLSILSNCKPNDLSRVAALGAMVAALRAGSKACDQVLNIVRQRRLLTFGALIATPSAIAEIEKVCK